ncbi:MAG: anaerobic ribonucleoside-triphosphate reductase [Candidatus Nanogingivalaceae bacterium]|nr:anaerobic ribonucleoside-triphosphate reductase [Candidatus Nanogingivalaceae bacterium]
MQKMQAESSLFKNVKVLKRDGREVLFDAERIYRALQKAYISVYGENEDSISKAFEISNLVIENLKNKINNGQDEFAIEEVQDEVEATLRGLKEDKVYHHYKNWRDERKEERESAKSIDKTINRLISKEATTVNENANKDSGVFATRRDLTAGVTGKAIGLQMLPEHVSNAHQKGEIHFHDLDYSPYEPMTNCCLIDFNGMLKEGYLMGNANIESPKSIQTAAAQVAQIIANVASNQYGGCSADRIDELLAPYAKKNYEKHLKDAKKWIEDSDKQEQYAREKTRKDIYDAMQSLEYEVNTLFTSNGQTPFVTFGFGLGRTDLEREIQKAILKIRIKGLGASHRTAIFPKLVFTLKRGVNLYSEDPNYDIKQLALECATKRMYPDVLSYDKIVELTGSFKVPMGCRSFLQGWKDENGEEVNSGRMNLGVVTLNLPRIAIESGGNFEKFWRIFDERAKIVKDALVFRVNRTKEALPTNAPILYQYGAFGKRLSPGDSVDEAFKNRRATVSFGYIGLYEVGTVFYGGSWETNPEAKEFTISIVRKMKELCEEWSNEFGYHFSVYSTPSESLTDRFCRLDKEKFGVIENITDKEYYTNSFHYDVRKNPTPFEKLDFEKDYVKAGATGGFIHYCEYPVLQQNPKALEAVWDYAYDRVGYLGTNTPIDRCYKCGFEGDFEPTEKGFKCPNCENANPRTCDVVKRTCGYLGNPQARPMVKGRHKEISARVKHMNGSTI